MARNQLVDCAKAYSCLLVVFGHVLLGIENMGGVSQPRFASLMKDFIWTFHVPLFMFLSGFVYRLTGEWRGKGTRGRFIIHKAINLGVPYLVFSAVYILVNSMIPGTNTSYSAGDILHLWTTPVAQFWFLRTLFFLFAMYALLSCFLDNLWITVLLTTLSSIHMLFPGLPFPPGGNIIAWAFSFGFGACLTSLAPLCFSGPMAAVVIMCHVVIEGALLATGFSGSPVVIEMERAVGIIASVTVVSNLVRVAPVRKCLLFISRYSFPVYLLHTFFTAGVRIGLKKAGILDYGIHVAVGTAAGVAIPLLVAIAMEKTGWMNVLLYPTRTMKQWKKERGSDES